MNTQPVEAGEEFYLLRRATRSRTFAPEDDLWCGPFGLEGSPAHLQVFSSSSYTKRVKWSFCVRTEIWGDVSSEMSLGFEGGIRLTSQIWAGAGLWNMIIRCWSNIKLPYSFNNQTFFYIRISFNSITLINFTAISRYSKWNCLKKGKNKLF